MVAMDYSGLLLLTIFLPLVGVAMCGLCSGADRSFIRIIALMFSVGSLIGALMLGWGFDPASTPFAATDRPWVGISSLDIRLSLGLDGLSIWMFVLSAILMVTCVLVSWEAIDKSAGLFYAMLLLLECGCLGVFSARDIILFYVFFEFTLIPLFFLIGIWGSEDRRYAARKFFVYTLAGSLLTFLGLLSLVGWDFMQQPVGERVLRFSIPALTASLAEHPLPLELQIAVFVALFAGFAIKVPLVPFHTWLPLAHVQAPAAGSVFLAGILLKIGTYGFLRFNLPMLPQASAAAMPWVLWLAVIGIVYGALVALAQSDMKRLIAYSSVSHLGYCMLGLFALNPVAVQGGALQMVNHGISTGGLFALVGMLYERYHTREIRQLGGLTRRLPRLAFFMLLFTFSSIGLPALNGFSGEFPILLGFFQRAFGQSNGSWDWHYRVMALLALSGVVLGAWYMLWMVQRVFFGPLREPHHDSAHSGHHGDEPVEDMSGREMAALLPLVVLVFWIGLYPKFFLDRMEPSIRSATSAAMAAVDASAGQIPSSPVQVTRAD